jgi:5'-nucleotidase
MDFLNLSNPPTENELANFQTLSPSKLPPSYKRHILDRIFVNRDLRLDRIKWIGFDMDYTIAVYKSPEYETLSYELMINKLIKMGYPESIKSLKYDPTFPIRGLFFDKQLGHFIKVDTFNNIILGVHGKTPLSKQKLSELYPSMYMSSETIGKRFYPISTLFNLPEACLLSDLIVYLESSGLHNKLSINNLFQDIRSAMDFVHLQGELKEHTLKNMEKYIKTSPKISILLNRLKKAGIKLFLLTNSDYFYTDKVMSFLLNGQLKEYKIWRDYFDIIIVSAKKPEFFISGTTLREVDINTGNLKIETADKFLEGCVYQGGSIALFDKYTGVRGNEVLYIGDHIYADIIKSKKTHAWRNMLIIPELQHELQVWKKNKKLYDHLLNLQFMKDEVFKDLDSESKSPPDISVLRKHIKQTISTLNSQYNQYFGSLFRNGSKQSHFSAQVQRYADLYTYDYLNLLNYPLFYQFSATYNTLPHEYTEPN